MTSVTNGVAQVNGIDLAYDVRGSGEPLLLIAGFGMTRVMWDEDFCDTLVGHGFQVVRLDNRDTGASTRLSKLGVPNVPKMFLGSLLGRKLTSPYRLEDMADDAFGVMSHLGHERFHVVGASMGGMIAQTMALDHGERLLSLTSIMSTPGGRRYSFAQPKALRGILQPMPTDAAAQIEHFVRLFRVIGGTGLPFDEPRARRTAEAMVASKPSPSGSARQFAAILQSSNRRRARLPSIKTPTLVIHGTHDPLLPVRGGKAMAKIIPGAELLVVEGMGHMVHGPIQERIAAAIAKNAKRAVRSTAQAA
jgi:pimeloyl-ACP methyl ester carboxylesterase